MFFSKKANTSKKYHVTYQVWDKKVKTLFTRSETVEANSPATARGIVLAGAMGEGWEVRSVSVTEVDKR